MVLLLSSKASAGPECGSTLVVQRHPHTGDDTHVEVGLRVPGRRMLTATPSNPGRGRDPQWDGRFKLYVLQPRVQWQRLLW